MFNNLYGVWVPVQSIRQQTLDPLEPEFLVVVSCLLRVLGAELWAYTRAASAVNS